MVTVIKPQIKGYGSTFGQFQGNNLHDYKPYDENIDPGKLGVSTEEDGTEFNLFEQSVKDFVLARLGHPVVRVELTPFQIKTAIDEAITFLYHHAPMWTNQFAVFKCTSGANLYEIPRFMLDNLVYVAYKKSLLTIAAQSGTLEFDFFIKYFQDNHLFSDFSVGEYFLLQQHLEMLRKILSQEGSFDVIDNKYLHVYPTPVTDNMEVIIEYRGLNADTIHPAYRNWIQRYALCACREILGEIRGKYKTLPGPGGGAMLNGPELIEQSRHDKEILKEELLNEIEEPPRFSTF